LASVVGPTLPLGNEVNVMIRTSSNIIILSAPLVLSRQEAMQIVEAIGAAFENTQMSPAQ